VRVGVVILPTAPWRETRSIWQRAEALGAHTAWTYDHLTWRELRDGPWYGALPLLSAVAATTSTVRLGTLVTSPNFRHPVTLAKEAMTLDDLSDGRLTLGIGAGGTGWDATALGQQAWTLAERTSRFAEFVEHLDRLLREPAVERLDGRWYQAVDARALPGCVQQPRVPFAIAATGPRGMAVAARHAATWVTYGSPGQASQMTAAECVDTAREQARLLDDACAAAGRDPSSIARLYLQGSTREPWLESLEAYRDLAGTYAALGFTDLALHWPRTEPPLVADQEVFEQILADATS
jgi:alkanesulfonate monooxygenase SsuD/methylene tetrahydromethanopterin reductase-like flavin-dependent oxidoreductase (luciferase family)